MNKIILDRVKQAKCQSLDEEISLIREIVQEIALLGLWRAKFYEHAAFYGGTALRLIYSLPRFSEDLDFSLLKVDKDFDLMNYSQAIQSELEAFGFKVSFTKKLKQKMSRIESAFIKGNTQVHLLEIESQFQKKINKEALFKVKLEVDIDPPLDFETSVHSLFWPIPFSVKSLAIEDLFAGKLHACLCRSERINIKGRDWYDFLWYVGRKTSLHLAHLEARMKQSQHLSVNTHLSKDILQDIFEKKISTMDFSEIKADVLPFIQRRSDLDAWSLELFKSAFNQLNFC